MKRCAVCNVELKRKTREGLSRFAKRKLCSLKCRQIYITKLRHKAWKPKICLYCEKEIERHISKLIYCNDRCMRLHRIRENSPAWKGGRKKHGEYYEVLVGKNHPFADLNGYILEHRYIMEKWLIENNPESKFLIKTNLGLYLNPQVKIHHKNHNKSDNRIENLVPLLTQKEHFHFNYCPQCPHCNKSGELLENPNLNRTISKQVKI